MRKVLLAGVLAVAALAALPDRSNAWGNDPYSAHSYGWFRGMAFSKMSWIHSQGPLYSYGPYYGPGYVNMHIPLPYHGSYSPADPNLWNGGYGVYGSALPAPAAGYAPNAVPGYGPPAVAPGPRVVPANYNPNPVRVIGR